MSGTVLTTGANSGLGLATVIEVARRGYRSVGSVRSEDKAREVVSAAADAGVAVETVLFDVTDADRCAAVIDEVGPLYGLVNNAGFGGLGAVEDVGDDEARLMFETMVLAPARLARLALPGMRAAGTGRIINMSSIFGRATLPLVGWYQGCKHALEALTDALRTEVAADWIGVTLIEPGGFKTGIWDDVSGDVADRQGSRYDAAYARSMGWIRRASPFMGDPGRVAGVVGRALDNRNPPPRTLVGYDAQVASLLDRITLTSVKDRVTRTFLGL
jgi:NAD(P)-dependent dehydrogenase (short-subunit alcohol dehydrogenase family)